MTREVAAIVASHSLALLMVVWTAVELTELPVRIFSLLHYLGQQSVLGTRSYWSTYYSLDVASHVIRALVTSLARDLVLEGRSASGQTVCRHHRSGKS